MKIQGDPNLSTKISGSCAQSGGRVMTQDALKAHLKGTEIILAGLDRDSQTIHVYNREPLPGRKAHVADLLLGLKNPATIPAPLEAEFGPVYDRDCLSVPAALAWNYLSHPGKLPLESLLSAMGSALFTSTGNLGGAWLPMAALLDRADILRVVDFVVGKNGERAGETIRSESMEHTFTRTDGLSSLAWAFLGTEHDNSFLYRKSDIPIFMMNQFNPDSFVYPFDRAADFLEVLAAHPGIPGIMDRKVARIMNDDTFVIIENPAVPFWQSLRVLFFSHMSNLAYRVRKLTISEGEASRIRNRLLQAMQKLLVLSPELQKGILELRTLYGSVPSDNELHLMGLGGEDGFRKWVTEAAAWKNAARALQAPVRDIAEEEPTL
jgi:hypothetical protein